jgi:prophage regulatory protein
MAASASALPKLPRLIAGDEICRRFGFSRQTLRRLVKDGLFPKPIRISRTRLGWRLDDVEKWVEQGGLDGVRKRA